MKYYGALEAGGTKMVLSRLDEQGNMLERVSMPTETPEVTMPAMIGWFREHPVAALGIGSFGPLDLNPASPTYGSITRTPKLAWVGVPLLKQFRDELGIPVGIDTDVNGITEANINGTPVKVRASAIAWSAGADGVLADYKKRGRSDDVYSWRADQEVK